MSELQTILVDLHLHEYASRIAENGFDTWDHLIGITETDMATLGFKLGHIRRLQREIARPRGHPAQEQLFAPPAVSPQTMDRYGRADGITTLGRQKRRYRRRPARDPHAPIRPDTGYVAYAKFLRQDPQVANRSFVEIAKLVGARWSRLSSEVKGVWNKDAAMKLDLYNSKLAHFRQTEASRGNGGCPEPEKVLPLRTNSAIAVEDYAESVEGTQHTGFELTQGSPTASASTTFEKGESGFSSSRCRRSSATSVCEGAFAGLEGSRIDSSWTTISQEQVSVPALARPRLSYNDIRQPTSQQSPFSTSFHVQTINPFHSQPREKLWPTIETFLHSVNSIYYLVNPDELWGHLSSALNTCLETPTLVMSKVCICLALGCQASPTSTADMSIMWYENGRRYLDDRDWCIDLAVMQILALVSLFHSAQRPATASHYLDTAIRIGEANKLRKATDRDRYAGSNWDSEWLNIWNTIQTMHWHC